MRKALSIILCLCMVLSVYAIVPFSATAAENEITETGVTSGTTGDCRWSLNGTELTISGNGKMANYSYNSTLPWGKSITKVTIAEGVTSIGDYAFYSCSSLTSVSIPDSVTSIGYDAFIWCIKLTSVTIPDSVTSIGDYAFYGCTGLTSVTIPDSVTSIGDFAFSDCSSLTSVNIGNSVTSISDGAFCDCTSLTSVNIPDSVTSIGGYVFQGCTSLTSVNIPDSVTSIGDVAFENCSNLTSVNIPDSVTSIGYDAFYYTAWYNNQPDGLVYAGKVAYKMKGTCPAEVEIKDGTLGIAPSAFYRCGSLTSVKIPDSVISIGSSAFSYCSSLTNIKVSENNPVYNSRNNCNAIIETKTNTIIAGCKNTVIPDSVTSISYSAFRGCSGLTSVTIPDSVTSIGDYAFYSCSSLTSVTIPDSVTSIEEKAFGYYYDNGYKTINGYTIYGVKGTEAERYSNSNNITFIPVTFGRCCNCHSLVKLVIGYPETCTEDGLTDGYTCNSCGYQQVQSVIPAHGHKPIIDKAVEATCQHAGHTVGSYCEYCGEVYVQSQVVPQLPHTPVTDDPAVEATCTRTGLTEGSHCSVCGDTIVAQSVINKLPHTAGEMVIENDVPVTCTTPGSHDEVVYCTVCKNEISRNTITTNALGHSYEMVSNKPATYFHTGLTDGVKCSRCGVWLIEQEEIPKLIGEGVFCDVDGDGEITIADATFISRKISDIEIPFTMINAMADADEDGTVTIMDVSFIQMWLANMSSNEHIGRQIA